MQRVRIPRVGDGALAFVYHVGEQLCVSQLSDAICNSARRAGSPRLQPMSQESCLIPLGH